MNTRIKGQTLVITLAMMAALTFGSSLAFGQLSVPRVQANTTLTLPDGSVLNLTSRFRADVDTNSAGNTIALTEATLEAPSVASVAACSAHACRPKERWLQANRIDAQWPLWGLPLQLSADNAREFKTEALSKGCAQWAIEMTCRPAGQTALRWSHRATDRYADGPSSLIAGYNAV